MKKMNKRRNRILVMVLVFAILCTSLPCTPTIPVHAAKTEKNGTWYEVSARINASWGGHIAGEITLTNVSSQTRQDWQIVFPWQAKISSMWNGHYEQTDDSYLITPMEYNRELAPEASVSVGFMAEGEDSELIRLAEEDFFQETRVSITDAEERENRTPSPSVDVNVSPTAEPAENPTAEPAINPTEKPVIDHTAEPTVSPTVETSANPTIEATIEPAASSTAEPTVSPTVEPTMVPTANPTVEPAVRSTTEPTVEPTAVPTNDPTAEPIEPTAAPTPEPAEDLYIYTDTTINEDLVCGNLFLMGGSLECNGHSITVQKNYFQEIGGSWCKLLDTDLTVAGNVCVDAGGMNISESSLHIGGNFTINSGNRISLEECSIRVAGDFSYNLSEAGVLEQEQSSIEIVGDMLINSAGWGVFSQGEISLHGDLIQTARSSKKSLLVRDGCILKFCGNQKQKIKLVHPDTATLGIMDFRETLGMEVPDILRGDRVIDFSKIGKKRNLRLELSNMVLEQDEVIDCQDVEWIGDLQGDGYDFAVKGNLTMRDGMSGILLYNGEMVVEGNLNIWNCKFFYLKNGELTVKNLSGNQLVNIVFHNSIVRVKENFFCAVKGYMGTDGRKVEGCLHNAGEMYIGGNLTIQEGYLRPDSGSKTEIDGDLRIIGLGRLKMSAPITLWDFAALRIGGNLLFDSAEQSILQNGRIKIEGDITQIEAEDVDNIKIEGRNFFIELCGTSEQTVDLSEVCGELNLDLTNSKAVRFVQEISGTRLVGAEKIVLEEEDLYLDYQEVELTGDKKIPGDFRCYGNLYVNGYSLEIEGKCIQEGSVYIENDGKMEVSGDYVVNQGTLSIGRGSIHIKGDVRIKKDAAVSMFHEDAYFLIDGNCVIGSRVPANRTSGLGNGTLELKGNLTWQGFVLTTGINLGGVHLIFSGEQIQEVQIPENAIFGYIKWLDLQHAAGVKFSGATIRANQVTGFSKLQTGGMLHLNDSRVTLTQNEEFHGSITMSKTYLDCNGYEFRLSDGGDLEQWDGLVNLDHGTLYVDGNYTLRCNSILQMIQTDDLLQVQGNFEIYSFMNHSSMLRNGRMELWGDFSQGGDKTSFASSENFVIAFMGSGQKAYFEDDKNSGFAGIDAAYNNVEIIDYPMILEDNMSFRIGRGILTGLQDALGIGELSDSATMLISMLGISLAVSTVIMPEVVVSVIGMIMGVIGVVSSAFTAVAAVGGIYSTAMGTGSKYDKAEYFAHDATMLVVSLINVWGSVNMIRSNLALYKSATQNLAGRATRPTPAEVVKNTKGARMISSFEEFQEYTKGFLDDDALQYIREALKNDEDDIAQLKKIAQLIEEGSQKIGKKLSKGELETALDVLWDSGETESALTAIEGIRKRIFREAAQSDADLIQGLKKKYTAGKTKNAACAKGNINGDMIDLECISGGFKHEDYFNKGNFEPPMPENYYYKGPKSDFVHHTEQKIVEYLRVKYQGNQNVSGQIEIISERIYCKNCRVLVDLFEKDFPNIKVIRVEVNK